MKQPLVNTFGAFGYSSVIVQWMWTIITIGLPVLTHDVTKQVFLPRQSSEPTPTVEPIALPGPIEQLIIIASIVLAIGVMIYAIYAIPRTVGRVGRAVTRGSAQKVATRVEHRHQQPMSKKRQRHLLSRLTWTFKYALATIPALLLFIPVDPSVGLNQDVVIVAGLVMFGFSLLWFTLQATLARAWHIGARDVW